MTKLLPIRENIKASYAVVFIVAGLLYIVTCAPGVLWQDSGLFQYRIWHNDIEGELGLALSHPLYHLIGMAVKYIPIGEFAYRVNLISAISAALAVANLFLLLRLWLGKNAPAVLGAVTLALSWTHWQFATMAEVYTLYSALFLAELVVLLQYVKTRRIGFLYLLAVFNGLAIANHMWASIPFACYVVFLVVLLARKQILVKNLLIMAGLWILGALPYEFLVIKDFITRGDFTATLSSALFGNGWNQAVLNTSVSGRIAKENLMFIGYNFPTPNIILFFAGIYGLKKVSPSRSFTNILLALTVLFFVFAFRYTVPDRYAFFVPFYCLVSVLAGVGFYTIITEPNRKALGRLAFIFALLVLPIYYIVPNKAEKLGLKVPTQREIPYRNDYKWFLQPWRTGYNGPERFGFEALSNVESDSLIFADGTTRHPLWYVQEIKGIKPHVIITPLYDNYRSRSQFPTEDFVRRFITGHNVYVVSPVKGFCPDFLLEDYDFVQAGVLWKVVERK